MENPEQGSSIYFCTCEKDPIKQENISFHLNLPSIHCIHKSSSTKTSFQKNILNRIHIMQQLQLELSQVSIKLIKKITQNTERIQSHLNKLISIHRKIINNPSPKLSNQMKFYSLVKVIKYPDSLDVKIQKFYNQQFLTEELKEEGEICLAKSKISRYLDKFTLSPDKIVIGNHETCIAVGNGNGIIKIWDLSTLQQTANLKGHNTRVTCLAFSLDDKILASGSSSGTVNIWSLKSNSLIHSFREFSFPVYSILISPDKKQTYAGGFIGMLYIFNLETFNYQVISIGIGTILNMLFIKNYQSILVNSGLRLDIVENLDKSIEYKVLIPSMNFLLIKLSRCEKFLLLLSGSVAEIWDFEKQKKLFEISGRFKYKDFDFCADSKHIYICTSYTIELWSLEKKIKLNSMRSTDEIKILFISRNGDQLNYICDNLSVTFLNPNFGYMIKEIKINSVVICALALSNNLKYFAYVPDKLRLRFVNLKTGQDSIITEFEEHYITYLKFSPDSSCICCGYSNGFIEILNVPCFTSLKNFELFENSIDFVCLSSDQRLIACSGDKTLTVICMETNDIKYSQDDHRIIFGVFCNEDLFCFDNLFLYILNKDFQLVKKIYFSNISAIIPSDDEKYALINVENDNWGTVSANLDPMPYYLDKKMLENLLSLNPNLRKVMEVYLSLGTYIQIPNIYGFLV